MKVSLVTGLLALGLLSAAPVFAEHKESAALEAVGINIDEALKERALGQTTAKVTIIEYSSMTCPHCAEFDRETFPKIKADYIDTGKIRYINRDFPLDGVGLKVALLARCVPVEHYFPFLDMVFKTQDNWAKASDPIASITPLSKFAGLNDAQIKACLDDKTLQDGVASERLIAQDKYKINSTPYFIFNDGAETLTGAESYGKFKTILDKLLAK